ncbi:MAG: hypothetical protein LQ348_001232 [Seirophora lacunosa]|nr:MAG: hypothetical protein LQ348_001232 [Seirophora lacunosa]
MSTNALLDHDFGSESEDDNFNPAPADESDNENAGGPDANDEPDAKPNFRITNGRDAESNGLTEHDADEDKNSARRRTSARPFTGNGLAGEDEAEGLNGDDVGDEEGEEDLDDEDDDEEEVISGRPRKRVRRDPRNQYLDVEAEVDEEEDEGDEEDEEGNAEGFIADTHPDDVADLPDGAETDDRRHRELDRQRERLQQLDAEKEAERLRNLYGRSRTTTAKDVNTMPKRLLLPGVDDPSIWGVKCKPGKEREVVFSIVRRLEERALTRNPLPIFSAFERGNNIPGFVYIEARRQADVVAALDGLTNVYPRGDKTVLIPIKEMPDLMRVNKTEQLQPGGYVRVKRGKYVGDLAQIDDVEENGLGVTLRIVPRLDYGLNEDTNAPMVDGGIKGDIQKRKRHAAYGSTNPAMRPPQRLFSDVEAKKKHSRHLQSQSTFDKKHWTYMGDTYVNGFLIKDFRLQGLITENVNPTLEEVTRFTAGAEDGTENLDLSALAASLKSGAAKDSYLPGDMVEVYEGEQQGVCGKAVSVQGDIVTLSVTEGDLRGQVIDVPVKGLRKRFREGDHVKVVGGSRYRDEVGMVVHMKKDQVTILSDMSMQEITVFSKDLREASDSGAAGGLGMYDIHDLVQLDLATVGCVIKVDRESLRILDQNGSVRSVMPSQISNKLERRRNAVATDRNGSEIRNDDTVREIGGEQKRGVILHIYRSFLFLHNREQTENSGISVVRASNVATVAAKGGRVAQASSGPDLTKMNPAMQKNGANGNGAMPPPKSFGRDRTQGQTVNIRKGPYKGLLGIVKDTTDTEARVELHTKGKTITVAKETLMFKDPMTGQNIDYQRLAGSRGRGDGGRGGFGGATPAREPAWASNRTPMAIPQGGRTPAWGAAARTPAWSGATAGVTASSSRTPAWQSNGMSGSKTPAWGAADGGRTVNPYNDGNRTAYGGGASGARTPAWNAGGAGHHDPFSGGRTPAYDSSRTPAYNAMPAGSGYGDSWGGSNSGHGSSRAYDAPTPGKDLYAAPTPNGGYASTPAAAAPTPKASGYAADAPTPYSGQPETPAGYGADDGPRYEELSD